jgi:zinc/manganese transport system ATP-binding protein
MLVEMRETVFGYRERPVVRVRELRLVGGRCLGIFGPNGVGKTTLVRGITGLLAPMDGTARRAAGLRFAYLPQHRAMDLHWPMTALDAAAMGVSARSRLGWLDRDDVARVREAMRLMRVDDLARRPFARLSGGQQQRVLLAGALASHPSVLVLDETTEGLDVRSRQMLLGALRDATSGELCTVMISHDVEDLLAVADEVAWLHAPEASEQPSEVEMIDPNELAERVASVRRAV